MRESQTQDSPDHDLASLITEEAFKGQEIIRLNAADSRAFVDALLRDSEPHERLKRAAEDYLKRVSGISRE